MKFISKKYKELRIVIKPMSKVMVGLKPQIVPGITVEFHNGLYETNNSEVIEALREHVGYGIQFFAESGVDQPSDESLRIENEKKAFVEELGSVCPLCGFQAKNNNTLKFHMKKHK